MIAFMCSKGIITVHTRYQMILKKTATRLVVCILHRELLSDVVKSNDLCM